MDPNAADRIIQVTMKWAEFGVWHDIAGVAATWMKAMVAESQAMTELELRDPSSRPSPEQGKSGSEGEGLEKLQGDASTNSALARKSVATIEAAQAEFKELETLIRTHAPTLLEYVPTVSRLDALHDRVG